MALINDKYAASHQIFGDKNHLFLGTRKSYTKLVLKFLKEIIIMLFKKVLENINLR